MDEKRFEDLRAMEYRIFAAQRDLVERCGGYKRVMERSERSKSEVGRWIGGVDQVQMPLLVVALLERDCGIPIVTTVLADFSGRTLSDPETDRTAQMGVMTAHAEAMRHHADYQGEFARSVMDGEITPAEAILLDRKLAAQERAIADQRASLAVIKAKGGAVAGLKVVGD